MPAIYKFAFAFLSLWCSITAARAETVTLPLQKFTASSSMELRCTHSLQSLSIPVPERWKLRKAALLLRYTVSNNLIGDLSQMTIRVNDEPISQTKLNPLNPSMLTDIQIPVTYLKPGYNRLDFEVIQHHLSGKCELPCAPDLWTNVSLMESTLQIEYDLKPLPLKLGEVAGLIFDPKQFPEAASQYRYRGCDSGLCYPGRHCRFRYCAALRLPQGQVRVFQSDQTRHGQCRDRI